MQHAVRMFDREIVHLDGQKFIDCEFAQCRLVFSGGEMPVFDNCQMHGCTWELQGAALRTTAFLRMLYNTGDKSLVDGILQQIKSCKP